MGMRTIIPALLFAVSALAAHAEERITSFDANIVVSREGEVKVTETIEIVAEGDRFRHGIYRDLDLDPAVVDDAPSKLEVDSVTRNGEEEPFEIQNRDGDKRILIGSPDVNLARGAHRYVITYRTDNRIRSADDGDTLAWDATGLWDFPMESVSATIKLPSGTRIRGIDSLAGTPDRPRDDLVMKEKSGALIFSTRRGLDRNERLFFQIRFPHDSIGPADDQ